MVDGFVGGVGGWGAMHAVCSDLAFDCCYSKLSLAWNILVEFAANSFELCTVCIRGDAQSGLLSLQEFNIFASRCETMQAW